MKKRIRRVLDCSSFAPVTQLQNFSRCTVNVIGDRYWHWGTIFVILAEKMNEKKKGKKKGSAPQGEEEEKLTKLEKAVAHWLRDQLPSSANGSRSLLLAKYSKI